MDQQRRSFYRIEYLNPGDCPTAKISGHQFPVHDLSEEAVRIEARGVAGFKEGSQLSGSLNFPDGESFLISGTVLRVSGSGIVIRFKRGFPLRKIMSEQTRLIRRAKGA